MPDEPHSAPEPVSLYERLGGMGGIAVIVDLWCERVLSDADLTPFFAGAERRQVRQEQTRCVVELVGDPSKAAAVPVPPLFARLPNSAWHAERVIGHLIAALVWANVPRRAIEAVLDLMAPFCPVHRPARPENGPPNGSH
jgi:hemoglobin